MHLAVLGKEWRFFITVAAGFDSFISIMPKLSSQVRVRRARRAELKCDMRYHPPSLSLPQHLHNTLYFSQSNRFSSLEMTDNQEHRSQADVTPVVTTSPGFFTGAQDMADNQFPEGHVRHGLACTYLVSMIVTIIRLSTAPQSV